MSLSNICKPNTLITLMRAGYAMLHTSVPRMVILSGLGAPVKAHQRNKKHTVAPRDKAIRYVKSWLDEGRSWVLWILDLKFPKEECRCMCTHSSLKRYSPGTQRSQCSDTNRPSMSWLDAFPHTCKFSATDCPILVISGMLYVISDIFVDIWHNIEDILRGAALTQ